MATKVEISKQLVMINSASSLIARALNISVLVWLHQYLLKRISPEEYSLLPVLMAVMAFAPLLTTILTSGLGRYITEAYAKDDGRGVTQITSTMFPMLLLAGIMVLFGGLTFSWYIDHILKIDPARIWEARIMMAILVFAFALRLPLAPFGVGLYVRQKFVLQNLINFSAELLRIALLFILLLGVSTRVLWVVVAMTSSEIMRLLIRLVISKRLIPQLKFRIKEIKWAKAKDIITFGSWTFLGDIGRIIRSAAGTLILNKLATPLDVTCFYIGSIPSRQFGSWHSFVYTPLLPALTAMHATENNKQIRHAYLRGGRYALWAAVAFGIPLIIFRNEIINLYIGTEFIAAASVMALLLATLPITMGQEMIFSIAHAKAEIHKTTKRVLIIQLASLALTLYLVGVMKMGAIGAAIAVMITEITGMLTLVYPLAFKMTEITFARWIRETLTPGVFPAIPAALVWITLKLLVKPNSWFSIIECSIAGGIIFVAALLGFCLQDYEKVEIKSAWKTIKKYLLGIMQKR